MFDIPFDLEGVCYLVVNDDKSNKLPDYRFEINNTAESKRISRLVSFVHFLNKLISFTI